MVTDSSLLDTTYVAQAHSPHQSYKTEVDNQNIASNVIQANLLMDF